MEKQRIKGFKKHILNDHFELMQLRNIEWFIHMSCLTVEMIEF